MAFVTVTCMGPPLSSGPSPSCPSPSQSPSGRGSPQKGTRERRRSLRGRLLRDHVRNRTAGETARFETARAETHDAGRRGPRQPYSTRRSCQPHSFATRSSACDNARAARNCRSSWCRAMVVAVTVRSAPLRMAATCRSSSAASLVHAPSSRVCRTNLSSAQHQRRVLVVERVIGDQDRDLVRHLLGRPGGDEHIHAVLVRAPVRRLFLARRRPGNGEADLRRRSGRPCRRPSRCTAREVARIGGARLRWADAFAGGGKRSGDQERQSEMRKSGRDHWASRRDNGVRPSASARRQRRRSQSMQV